MKALISLLAAELRDRWRFLRANKDAGYSTETVVITALLVTLAIVVVTIIAIKVTNKANSINLG